MLSPFRVALALLALGVLLVPYATTGQRDPARVMDKQIPTVIVTDTNPHAEPDPEPEPVTTTTLAPPSLPAYGSRSEEVRAFQAFLVGQGFELAVDGAFGPQTAGAARAAGYEVAVPITMPALPVTNAWPVSLEPCGGDLPPCWVKWAESKGDYGAVNWGGCGGWSCFGAWQFSGAWAGRLGLPQDLRSATPEQQDNAARELFDGGRGCSHWNACGR